MQFPQLDHPERYQGLYVFQHGDWTAVGYTADEVGRLLEQEAYRDGKVYKIHRASPDGRMELRGVAAERFMLESGLFFYRDELRAAREDFDRLVAAATEHPLPARAFVQLVERKAAADFGRFATVLIFPAEYEDEMGQWLLERDYVGGDRVEGGISHVTNFYEEERRVMARHQFVGRNAERARSTDELLASFGKAVQR